ncbi:hypothetical protein DQ788_22260, partial [Salmonella bongori]|nr:hypothetical protein [Salmonella bongori]
VTAFILKGLTTAQAAPVEALATIDITEAPVISHELQTTPISAGSYDTGTALALGIINSNTGFSSVRLKWDRAVNPAVSGAAREAYVVDTTGEKEKKIQVSFEVQHGDQMTDGGDDAVNVTWTGGQKLTDYGYSVILTRPETLAAGHYKVAVLADVTII